MPHREPTLLASQAQGWAPAVRWTTDYLRELVGDRSISVESYSTDGPLRADRLLTMTLKQYLDEYRSSAKRLYAAELDIQKDLPELKQDLSDSFALVPQGVESRALLFIGHNSVSPLHYHEDANAALVQLRGEKRIILFPPSEITSDFPWYSAKRNFSAKPLKTWVDGERGIPGLSNHFIEFVLRPGDVVLIPVHWWHAVHGPDSTISLTFFWDSPLQELTISKWLKGKAGSSIEKAFLTTAKRLRGKHLLSLCVLAEKMGAIDDGHALAKDLERLGDHH